MQSRGPRIDQTDAKYGEVANVPGGDVGSVRNRARRNERVDRVRYGALRLSGGSQPASLLGDSGVDGYDAADKSALDCRHPCEEFSSARGIGRPLGAVNDLMNCQHRNERIGLGLYECLDARFRARTHKLG